MPSNRKLTKIIHGRTIQTITQPCADRGSTYLLQFDDGSRLRIKTEPDAAPGIPRQFWLPYPRRPPERGRDELRPRKRSDC